MSLLERLAKIQCEIALIKIEKHVEGEPLLDIQLGAIKYEVDKMVEMIEDAKSPVTRD